ncbi:hypothetical protein PZN02_003834 [Sinorhizobium garamanticum]|uniref:Uncharacterized protein n=1 Tax=Sinorhizobium garamanticum TaxID=680247 RepID=A0ABY8D999_9HYPH|nr:hypothetical protein [Sinorhizobium garamanticum]WEX87444.1 hypothetical protein PZN02_003834 [Sinorhizobium garamanticum]
MQAYLTMEQKKNKRKTIAERSHLMTDFVRDLAAFASMSLFIASISVIALGL